MALTGDSEMAVQYRTSEGDVVDAICWKHYEAWQLPGAVERVYSANPGLATRGAVLPAGLLIELPDVPRPEAAPIIRIWG